MAKFVNLTPHDVTLFDDDGSVIRTFRAHGRAARALERRTRLFAIQVVAGKAVQVNRVTFGGIGELPPPQPDVWVIVSRIAAETASAGMERDDLLIPDEPVRDAKGAIIGFKSFAVV